MEVYGNTGSTNADNKFRLSQNILQAHFSSKVVITNINCTVLIRKPRGRGIIDAIVIKKQYSIEQ